MTDRRDSAWADPKTWIAIISVLLTILIYVGSVISRQLTDMNNNQKETNAHLQKMEVEQGKTNTHNDDEIAHLKDGVQRLRTGMDNQDAYNFGMNKAVTEMATTLRMRGLPTPQIPSPPKLGGQ